MGFRILHILDSATPADSMEILASLVRSDVSAEHHFACVGNRSTAQMAGLFGLPVDDFHAVRALAWWDVAAWRTMGRLIQRISPTHVHAWGITGGLIAAMGASGAVKRLVTLGDGPVEGRDHLLSMMDRGTWKREPAVGSSPCRWIVTGQWIARRLVAAKVAEAKTTVIPFAPATRRACPNVREKLGIREGDGPVVLLGGEPGEGIGRFGRPRHDLGLWVAGILQQIFPRIRVLLTADPRGRADEGLGRLLHKLPDNDIVLRGAAGWTWEDLLSVSDVMMATPDGAMATGSVVHAMKVGVLVIGTPVEPIKELIADGKNGVLTGAVQARAISAAVEAFLADRSMARPLIEQAKRDVVAKHEERTMIEAYRRAYAS
jgi:glycosyltransferase involved in cell wall biosynthesis